MTISSQEYWRSRELKNLQSNLKKEEEYVKELNEIYDYMIDRIQKEINGFYTKYATAEGITMAEAKKRVAKLDIEEYERKAAKYVKDKTFTSEANEEMRLYNATMKINRLEMLKANIGLELVDSFDDLQKYFEETLTERTLSEFERQAGILGKTVTNNAEMAGSIVNASFKNATFSDRIWMYQNQMKAELSKLLQEGLIQGRNPKQLAPHLQKLFGVSKYNAERLMRTELARVQTDAQKQSFIKNGFEEYTYVACGKADVCNACKALDGKHFKVDDMMPGTNAPPMHPNCHCSVAAYLDTDEYNEWLDTYKDHGLSFEDWKEQVANSSDDGTIDTLGDTLSRNYKYASTGEYNALSKQHAKNTAKIDATQIKNHKKADGSSGGYAATRNYQSINRALRDEDYSSLDSDDMETIDALRRGIKSNTLDGDYTLTRYVNSDYLSSVFSVKDRYGDDLYSNMMLNNKKNLDAVYDQMKTWIGKTFTEKSFVSSSLLKSKNIMSDKPIRLTINAKSGTNCYLPKNKKESECILGENTKFYITEIKETLDGKLEIFVTVIE